MDSHLPLSVRDALVHVADHVQNMILLADDEQRYVYANPAASRILGYTNAEFMRMTLWDLTPVPDQETAKMLWAQFIDQGRQAGEFRIACKSGEVRVFQYSAVANIAPGIHLSDLHDITDLVLAEEAQRERVEQKLLLIREMHHRVRNILASVLAVVRMHARDADDPQVRDLVSRMATRVEAMFEANRLLRDAGTGVTTVSLRTLLTEITRTTVAAMALDPERVRWSVESPDREITWDELSPVSLVVNEVLTNFFKYSLPRGQDVRVRIAASGGDPGGTALRIEFSRSFSAHPGTWQRGFGMELIEALVEQLGATHEWQQGAESAVFVLVPQEVDPAGT
jgi:PAS domain S-box-containing protein